MSLNFFVNSYGLQKNSFGALKRHKRNNEPQVIHRSGSAVILAVSAAFPFPLLQLELLRRRGDRLRLLAETQLEQPTSSLTYPV